tara:strand:+ start:221 stop:373 length:153 start_codon:yes stop_codon:yes gene_type:complete
VRAFRARGHDVAWSSLRCAQSLMLRAVRLPAAAVMLIVEQAKRILVVDEF